jgi:hypothetical protein
MAFGKARYTAENDQPLDTEVDGEIHEFMRREMVTDPARQPENESELLAEPVDKNDPKSVRKIRRIAEKLVDCALNGEPWAISQVADRIDGKATAEIQTEQRHRYVIEAPAQLTREQWIEKYSPKTISSPEAIPALPQTTQ